MDKKEVNNCFILEKWHHAVAVPPGWISVESCALFSRGTWQSLSITERDGNQMNTSYLRFDRLGMLLRVWKNLTFLRNYIGHSKNITSCFILFQLAVGNLTFLSHSMFSRGAVQPLSCLQWLLSVSMVPLQVLGAWTCVVLLLSFSLSAAALTAQITVSLSLTPMAMVVCKVHICSSRILKTLPGDKPWKRCSE